MTLLAELRSVGIDVRPGSAGQVVVRSARGQLTEDQLAGLRRRKPELLAELAAERRAAADEQRERMRAAVIEALDRDRGISRAWLSELDQDGDYIVAIAIRGVGTAELWIARERYDAAALLATIIDAETADRGEGRSACRA